MHSQINNGTAENSIPYVTEIDWGNHTSQLRASTTGNETDELIDSLTQSVFDYGAGVEASPCMVEAVNHACSDLSLRSAALALALVADGSDTSATDALVEAFQHNASHPFLAPALIEALGLFALRSPLALAELSSILIRLDPEDERYLLLKAAQVLGGLDAVQPAPTFRNKLEEFTKATDPMVQAEARQQIALVTLADLLLSEDLSTMDTLLTSARVAFARAEMSEEHRPDATLFRHLLDMLLEFRDVRRTPEAKVRYLNELTEKLRTTLKDLVPYDWRDYASDRAVKLGLHALRICDSLRRGAEAVAVAEEWTDFGTALEHLARLHAEIRGERISSSEEARVTSGLGQIADRIFAATLGPLLARVVQQRRISRVVSDYALAQGDNSLVDGLRALEQAAASATFTGGVEIPGALTEQIAKVAKRIDQDPDSLLKGFLDAIESGTVPRWAEELGLNQTQISIEQLGLYGEDPAVDELVRPLLRTILELLGDFPPHKWVRLVEVLISLVKFNQFVRDRTPEYLVCAEDGGLGQNASENDLQDHLFEWLRQVFGRTAVYEFAKTGGGRPDTGVIFQEARFPVEVKHEFASINPQHVLENYVAQTDVYATAADRVSFLTILDLRSDNAEGHRDRRRMLRKTNSHTVPAALYHIRDSFRVESLPADSDLPDATIKVVIVSIIPGNRPLPSSMSTYSSRPRSARRKRHPSSN